MTQPSFVCPVCSKESFNPHDVAEGYCGQCHAFTGECAVGCVNKPTTVLGNIAFCDDHASEMGAEPS